MVTKTFAKESDLPTISFHEIGIGLHKKVFVIFKISQGAKHRSRN